MAMDLKDFILKFYSVYHVSQMDSARAARWRDLRGKPETGEWNPKKNEFNWLDDKRSPPMKGWENKATGDLYTIDDLPNPITELSDDDWKSFYTTVRTAMRNIDANRKDLLRNADPKVLAIDRFFGNKSVKAFSPFEPDPAIVRKPLESLGAMLENPAMADFANWLEAAQPGTGYKIFTEKPTLGEFINGLKTGNYDINKGIPNKIKDLLSNILGWLNPSFGASPIAIFPGALAELKKLFGNNGEKIAALQIAMDADNEKIDPHQLAQFKQPSFYKEILKALYASDKPEKKSPFNSQFANAGGGEITGWMAESVTGANDYDTALMPKLEDEKNWRETQIEKITDWRDEHLKRLYDRSARHVYIESNAAPVVAAILKEKVSPTDGVLKIIEKKDAIIKRVKGKQPSAVKGTEFMFEALEYIKNSGDMDKALEGCFRNGAKAQAVAMEVIKYAMAKGKVNEAKVALETLAVMRYDTLSSAHWGELKKNPIKPFDGTSFMKNDSIKFVLDTATKGLNLGLAGAYWTGVVGRNLIQKGRAEIPKSKIKSLDIGRVEVSLKKINKDTEDFMTLEDAERELLETQTALSSYETAHKGVLDLQDKEEKLSRIVEELKKQRDINVKHQRINDIIAWWNGVGHTMTQTPTFADIDVNTATPEEIFHELGLEGLQQVLSQLGTAVSGTSPQRGFNLAQTDARIALFEGQLTATRTTIAANPDIFQERDRLIGAERAIRSEKERLADNKARGLKGETDHKPYGPPKSPLENTQMLMAFWNAANGFTELSVDSYNIFKNIKAVRKKSDLKNDFDKYFASTYQNVA